jgi:hypothetical protein
MAVDIEEPLGYGLQEKFLALHIGRWLYTQPDKFRGLSRTLLSKVPPERPLESAAQQFLAAS